MKGKYLKNMKEVYDEVYEEKSSDCLSASFFSFVHTPVIFWRVYVFSAVCPLSGGFHLDRIRGVSSYDMIKRWWDRSFRAALMVASLESLE